MSRARTATVAVLTALALLLTAACSSTADAGVPSPTSTTAAPPLATPVLSARRVPELIRSNIADGKIRDAMGPLLATAPANSCIIVSNAGRVVIDRNGSAPMTPASTQKLLVAAAVLDQLGPDVRLTTTATAQQPAQDGVIEGDLYLVGGGDPLLTTAGYKVTLENPEQLVNDFNQMADVIAASGVREIRGGIVGDDSRYDQERWIPTWPARYQNEGYVGPIGALTVNDGNTGLSLKPNEPSRNRKTGDPPALAAETLKSLLEARGVHVAGAPSAGLAPEGTTEIAHLDSPPMSDLVGEMIAESDNTTAEMLVKELGYRVRHEGTTKAGLAVLEESLARQGLDTTGLSLVDGSGLDPSNRASCRLLVSALDLAGEDSSLAKQLPIAGETGTLRKRMRGTPAQGKVHAKTGTLSEVNALAGFAATTGGAALTFSYLINGPEPRGSQPIDDFAAALVGVPDGPAVDQLAPKRPGT